MSHFARKKELIRTNKPVSESNCSVQRANPHEKARSLAEQSGGASQAEIAPRYTGTFQTRVHPAFV
jgi:hypothetical protein